MKASTLDLAKKILLVLTVVCFAIGMIAPGCSSGSSSSSSYSMTDGFKDIKWPTTGMAALLPKPESTFGKISTDSSDSFWAYIGNTSQEQYDAYVEACISQGFVVDYSKGESYYYALDEAGNDLSLSYTEDKSYMSIGLSAPSNDPEIASSSSASSSAAAETTAETPAPASAPEATPQADPSSTPVDGIRPDIKAAIDSYETFINEYCDFMQKYSESSNPASMAADYAKFMAQYADTMSKLDAMEDADLSPEEDKYYLDAMVRINQKLSNTAAAM